jgi:hypothetical protein
MAIGELTVCKKTGSYTDALLAIGLADLISSIESDDDDRKVRVIDDGDGYIIKAKPELTIEELQGWQAEPGYIYIQIKKKDSVPPGVISYDYEGQRELEKNYREFKKATAKKRKTVEKGLKEQGVEAPPPPLDDLSVIKTFNSMRMGSNAYNKLFQAINQIDDMSEIVLNKLSNYGFKEPTQLNQPNEKPLQSAVATLQLFNPVAGKGVHRPKPDSSSPGSISNRLLDWFEEWMKFRAMHIGLLAYYTGSDGKDTKVMVIAPGDIGVENIKRLRNDLLKEHIWGSVWLDIQAVLHLSDKLIRYSDEFNQHSEIIGTIKMAGRRPKDIVRGIYNTYFKNLGTASAVMNVSFLGLPGWFKPIKTYQDAEQWLEILSEHKKCLSTLDESHSDDVALLLLYRDFLSSGSYKPLLYFFGGYGAHFIRAKIQKKRSELFTTINLRRLFMDKFEEVIKNEGFLNLATAIRKATVNPQIRKSMTGKAPFEIQYGLAQNWKRKAKFKNEFVIELTAFSQRYNAENARCLELNKETRKNITTKDLDQVLGLIDKHGSEVVGLLLLAYGYARDSKDEEIAEKEKKED